MNLEQDKRAQLQRILGQYEYLRAQLEALSQQLNRLDLSRNELDRADRTLKEVNDLKEGSEVLVPIGANSFVHAKITDTEKVIVGLGADVAAEKTVGNARKSIKRSLAELGDARKKIEGTMEEISKKMEEIRPEAEKLLAEIQQGTTRE